MEEKHERKLTEACCEIQPQGRFLQMGKKHLMLLRQESRYSTVEWDFEEKPCRDKSFYELFYELSFFICVFFALFLPFPPFPANPPCTEMVSELLLAVSVL